MRLDPELARAVTQWRRRSQTFMSIGMKEPERPKGVAGILEIAGATSGGSLRSGRMDRRGQSGISDANDLTENLPDVHDAMRSLERGSSV